MLDPEARKLLYAYLSVLFRHPDDQTLGAVTGVEEKTFEALFPGLAAPPVPSLPELQQAYRHLFMNTGDGAPVPPYGSAYLEKGGKGQSTRLVAGLYASAGLNTEESPEPPDYLPTELEFLYYLTEGERQSRDQDTGVRPHRWVASQADFFHNFFNPWIEEFCGRITRDDQAHPFYLWAAELLRRFVETERERLKAH